MLVSFNRKLRQYSRQDLGQVQKMIQVLIVTLILFNEPLWMLKESMGMIYLVMQSTFESLFIACLMFFWLVLMHAIATQDNIINIQ